jgi:hypothetical protein
MAGIRLVMAIPTMKESLLMPDLIMPPIHLLHLSAK